MSISYLRHGTNAVCTNMTSPYPVQIGIETCPWNFLSGDGLAVLNTDARKLSACFNCKLPYMAWEGLDSYLCGLAIGAVAIAGVALTIMTCGADTIFASVAAMMIPTGDALATSAVMWGSALLVDGEKLGYDVKHFCDVLKDGQWKMGHTGTFVKGKPALLQHSFLLCPRGGVVTVILDDDLAKLAAENISAANQKIISTEKENQRVQGIISGLTGGANPISLAVSILFAYNGGAEDVELDHYEMMKNSTEDKNFEYDYAGKIAETAEETAAGEATAEALHQVSPNTFEGGTYTEAKGNPSDLNEAKKAEDAAKESCRKKEGEAASRDEKLKKRSHGKKKPHRKMKGRKIAAQQKARRASKVANKAAENTEKIARKMGKQLFETLLGFGVGVLGAGLGIWVDSENKEDEFYMTESMIGELLFALHEDDTKPKIVANDF